MGQNLWHLPRRGAGARIVCPKNTAKGHTVIDNTPNWR